MHSLMLVPAIMVALLVQPATPNAVHKCLIEEGNEPNFDAGGCETYWSCYDYVGKLAKCTDGDQFDFWSRKCAANGDVWCQWQHQIIEERREEAKGSYSDDDEGAEEENYEEESERAPEVRHVYHKTNGEARAGEQYYEDDYDEKTYEYDYKPKSPSYYGYDEYEGDDGYICESEWGHEPNLDDEYCHSFWRCDEYKGSLIACKPGLRYNYKARACTELGEMSCKSQFEDFTKAADIPSKRRLEKTQDGLTIVHHYYHGNTHPGMVARGDDLRLKAKADRKR